MMSDCPLAFYHKKEEYICSGFLLTGGDFCICGVCGAIRLYLGALLCIYILFWLMIDFLFLIGFFMIGGDTLIGICFLFHIINLYL